VTKPIGPAGEETVGIAEHDLTESSVARHSFFGDVLSTTAVQGLTALLNATSLAIISRRLGDFNLGLYTLERRGCALIQPLVLLGITVAAPRYIALAVGKRLPDHRSYALTGAALVGCMAATTAALIAIWPAPVAAVVFGDAEAVGLARALAGFVVVSAMYLIVYAVFRGYLRMRRANGLELATIGLIPVALAAAGPTNLVAFMWALNAGTAGVTVLSLSPWRWLTRRSVRGAVNAWRWRGGELLRYGIPRTPGDFATVAPFALTPVVVVQFADATQAGYTSVVLSTLNLVSVVAGPLGVLVLPHVALELGRLGGVTSAMWARLAEATFDVALVVAALLFLASPLVVAIWFPDVPPDVVAAQRAMAVGIPGYVFYMVFRSYLDAIDVRPLSSVPTVTGLVSLAVALPLLLLAPLSPPTLAASTAVSISVTAMGAVTWWLVRTRLAETIEPGALVPPVLAALAIVVLGIALDGARLASIATAGTLAAFAYLGLLVALRRPWLVELAATATRARGRTVRWR
jgi:O-antigen/teichoic acid export membrane protein